MKELTVTLQNQEHTFKFTYYVVICMLLMLIMQACDEKSILSTSNRATLDAIVPRSMVDTMYVLTDEYSLSTPTPTTIRLTFDVDVEWRDNNGGTYWNSTDSQTDYDLSCSCIQGSGTCTSSWDVSGPVWKGTCDKVGGCENCEMKVVISRSNIAIDTVYNGITIRDKN